jgi:amidase
MIAAPEEGVIGDRLESSTTKVLPVKEGHVIFNDIKLPLRPMIGVIGTAPAEGEIPNGTPDSHGGNMDCKRIIVGSTLYLPVAVEGGLLSLGDLHAVMGDGEIAVCGAEIRGKVRLKVDLLKGCNLPLPMLEDDTRVMTIASAETLDQASDDVTNNMVDYLVNYYDYSLDEAGMLLSLIGDLRVCQVVDPLKTARFEIEKEYINDRDIWEVIEDENK